jgi:signal transduction histidine kinase
MSATLTGASPAGSPDLSSEEIERRVRQANLFAARLQLFVSSALLWLIFIFGAAPNTLPPVMSTLVLGAWLVASTLVLSYLALRGGPRFLAGPLPGRVALIATILTVLLATSMTRDSSSDFYLIYFFPIGVATIYYGLRGGLPTAALCALSYVFLAVNESGGLNALLGPLLIGRIVFLFAVTGAIGVGAEGQISLVKELRHAFADLRDAIHALEVTKASLARRVEEAATLERVAREFTATLQAERVLHIVLEQVETIMGAEATTLMALDGGTNELVFQIPLGSKAAQLQGYRIHVGQGVAGWVAEHNQPLRVDNPSEDRRHFQAVDRQVGFHTRSILCVPMSLQDRVTGVIEVMNKKSGSFTADDENLLTAVAQWAAIAIENARLFHDLQQSVEDLKKAQELLVRAERLRALGEMAGGVAHDFNNLLTIILAESQMLIAKPRDEGEKESLRRIENAARDAAQAVRRIQEYSRVRRDTPREIVQVDDLVRQAVEITRPRWQASARLELHTESAGSVMGNPAELREVLTNLIFNAVDARAEGRECQIAIRTRSDADRWATIEVEDNGTGIAPEVRAHIFDPYFTTKTHGTGLGLSLVYGLITRHGGEVHVASPLSLDGGATGGTRFEIRLPLALSLPEAPKIEAEPPAKRFTRVLFVDDDLNVLESASNLLTACDYQVATAQNVAEASKQLAHGDYDVMLTDLTMPECSGWDMARRAKELWRDKPVVLVTGWGLQLDSQKMNEGLVDGVLTKPFTLEELTRTLDNLPRPVVNSMP